MNLTQAWIVRQIGFQIVHVLGVWNLVEQWRDLLKHPDPGHQLRQCALDGLVMAIDLGSYFLQFPDGFQVKN